MTHAELPEDRVAAYLEYIQLDDRGGDVIDKYNGVTLTVTDLQDVIREVKAWRDRANELEERILVTRQYAERNNFNIHMGVVWDMLADEGDAEQGEPITAEDD